MRTSNIDISDARLNTKAPFQWNCPLRLWGSTLPSGAFISIKVYLPETAKPPVRLYQITEQEAIFHDATGALLGSMDLAVKAPNSDGYVLSFIKSPDGILVGHVAAELQTSAILKQAAILAGGTFYTAPNDFVLLPQCHVQALSGKARVIRVDGVQSYPNAYLYSGSQVMTSVVGDTCTFSLYGDYKPTLTKNRICNLVVNGTSYSVQNQHLLLIPGVQSNLRIVKDVSGLTFKGVKDV